MNEGYKQYEADEFHHKRDEQIFIPADAEIEIEVYVHLSGNSSIKIQNDRDTEQFQQYAHRDCVWVEEDKGR